MAPSSYEWSFYPTLWRDGDVYELGLDENPSRVIESVGLNYSTSCEKSVELFRNIVLHGIRVIIFLFWVILGFLWKKFIK